MALHFFGRILRSRSQFLPVARSVSKEEAQYWLEKSSKQDVFPKQESSKFSKLDHLDEFGPCLSSSVYKNKQIADKVGYNSSDSGNIEQNVKDVKVNIIDSDEQITAAELPMETKDGREKMIQNIARSVPLLNESPIETKDDRESISQTIASVPLLNESRPIAFAETISDSDEIYKLAHIRDPSMPSVSRILSATMSEESKAALARWEKEKIAVLGLAGFKQMKADTFARGHTLHNMLETYMENKQLPKAKDLADKVSKRHLVSISQTVKQFDKPLLLESAVIHQELNYCGIVDCVAVVGNTLALVDWKTSEKVKNNAAALYDNPLQVAAYIGALNRDPRYSSLGNINSGVVVVVYNSGYPAMVHEFNQEQMEMYWEQWCTRLQMYKDIN
jgi:ATP-dependent exoDNAse (exonuclease V) beta subunit